METGAQVAIDNVMKFLPALAPVIVELAKKFQQKVIPSLDLPWPAGILIKTALSAIAGAVISYFTGLDPMTGAGAGASASVGYAIARPKAPKE